MLPVLYAVTLFSGAATLFLVQPLVGKLLLPLVGGSPGVWNTCMVFFQAVLLAGYLYAHRSTGKFGVRRQAAFHLLLLAAVLVSFQAARAATGSPVAVLTTMLPDDQDYPVLGLVALLTFAVGVPFFVLSTTSPLLQRWFAATGHPSAKDPYFLYAASNAGSLLGLLGYPLVIEPRLTLAEQQWVFAGAVTAYLVLVAVCAATVIGRRTDACVTANDETKPEVATGSDPSLHLPSSSAPTTRRILRWVFLAALPSSLLLGVTAHVSANLAPVPLLWAVPLSLYLVSFILVFARWPDALHHVVGRVTPVLLLLSALSLLMGTNEPFALVGALHMGAFFGVCLVCHGELARDRPRAEHLTAFYFWMSLGGVLGGLFNGLFAPVAFCKLGMVEYPLAIVLAAAVRPRSDEPLSREPPLRAADVALVAVLLAITVALVLLVPRIVTSPVSPDEPEDWALKLLRGILIFGLPAVAVAALVRRPARFAVCLGALFVAGAFDVGRLGETLHMERNFYGVVRVARSPDGKFVRLIHGTTVHGQQRADEAEPRPMTYYTESGPVGRLFQDFAQRGAKLQRVGVVGLGIGTVAYYAQSGQEWTFFEIDPAVARIAQNPDYFRFLDCARRRGATIDIVLGDARRQLTRMPDGQFDLLILDGFCSDAMPVHLLTREAFALYLQKLKPDGVLAVNVTNPHLDMPPLVVRTARLLDDPPTVVEYHDRPSAADRSAGKTESQWVVLTRSHPDDPVVFDPYWWRPTKVEDGPVWRDDFANILAAWKKH